MGSSYVSVARFKGFRYASCRLRCRAIFMVDDVSLNPALRRSGSPLLRLVNPKSQAGNLIAAKQLDSAVEREGRHGN